MILSASDLTKFQRCARIPLLEKEGRGRWIPKALFDVALRKGILLMSQGHVSPALEAEAFFRQQARSPGVETTQDSWTLSGDYCAMLHTVLEGLSRISIPRLAEGPIVELESFSWRIGSFWTPLALERFVTVESYGEAAIYREIHGWGTSGDLAALPLPMNLHFIEIGLQKGPHRLSPWCMAYKHDGIQQYFRFKSRKGGPLKGKWSPTYFADKSRLQDPKRWVDLMENDKLSLIHSISLRSLESSARNLLQAQAASEASRLQGLSVLPLLEIPMSRGACDFPHVCPWQSTCYSEQLS